MTQYASSQYIVDINPKEQVLFPHSKEAFKITKRDDISFISLMSLVLVYVHL